MKVTFEQTVNVNPKAWAAERNIPIEDVKTDVIEYFKDHCQFQVEECMCLQAEAPELEIAKKFCSILKDWLNTKEFLAVVSFVSFVDENPGTPYCQSHEYVDGNQAMLDAFQHVMNREVDPQEMLVLDRAWKIAKDNRYFAD